MNKDRLNNMRPHASVDAAYSALSANQGRPPEEQVAGAAVLFLTICEVLKLDISDTLATAANLRKADDLHYQVEVQALKAYIAGELK